MALDEYRTLSPRQIHAPTEFAAPLGSDYEKGAKVVVDCDHPDSYF